MSDDSNSNDSNVINFPIQEIYATDNIPTQNVFDGIQNNNLETVVVVGWTKEGNEYFASSTPNGMEIIWLLERLKYRILKDIDDE